MEAFEEFWKAYPKRDGANPKQPALAKFILLIKGGKSADEIVGATIRYRDECEKKKLIGTPYLPMAKTWLHQHRWLDYLPPKDALPFAPPVFVEVDSPQWVAWRKIKRVTPTEFREVGYRSGWYFESEWPPQEEKWTPRN